jgi:hypothetical protein
MQTIVSVMDMKPESDGRVVRTTYLKPLCEWLPYGISCMEVEAELEMNADCPAPKQATMTKAPDERMYAAESRRGTS